MESSPRRTWLYRTGILAVTLLTCIQIAAQGTITQYGRKAAVSKGPRALGLVMLYPNGKARMIPVAIAVDGKFFDAGSYKGTPVPMALDFGIVYECFRTGVSQGLFTITQPGQLHHSWIAEGTWLPAGAKPATKGMKYETPKIDDKDAPPRLHRGGAKPAEPPPAEKPASPPPKPQETVKVQEPPAPTEDPNRPVLRRGKPDPSARHEPVKDFDAELPPAKSSSGSLDSVKIIPAISDIGGADPRPYTYDMKPAEEASYRSKMLELASKEIRARAIASAQDAIPARGGRKASAKPSPVAFDDVHLRVFDLTTSNEPILILSAKTHPSPNAGGVEPEEITLVARTNLEGELRKLFFQKTDSRHMDVYPRMELIDAVDAEGDGRGELLFRRTFDSGSSFAIYRATSDQLWPLYEGNP